ncbi:MAG TPA: coenzyme F420-0:L-glutamate ligase, partial [Polyangia bacterium]|nr:coenzyme F420-0:L-glutamate ligase [Polyangia bacterium]
MIRMGEKLEVVSIPGIPLVSRGDDLVALIAAALSGANVQLRDGDVLVVTSKIVSRAEGRFVALPDVEPSPRAVELGAQVGKDARLAELVLREATSVSRVAKGAPGAIIVRHRLGFIVANAGIDSSNAMPVDAAPDS